MKKKIKFFVVTAIVATIGINMSVKNVVWSSDNTLMAQNLQAFAESETIIVCTTPPRVACYIMPDYTVLLGVRSQ